MRQGADVDVFLTLAPHTRWMVRMCHRNDYAHLRKKRPDARAGTTFAKTLRKVMWTRACTQAGKESAIADTDALEATVETVDENGGAVNPNPAPWGWDAMQEHANELQGSAAAEAAKAFKDEIVDKLRGKDDATGHAIAAALVRHPGMATADAIAVALFRSKDVLATGNQPTCSASEDIGGYNIRTAKVSEGPQTEYSQMRWWLIKKYVAAVALWAEKDLHATLRHYMNYMRNNAAVIIGTIDEVEPAEDDRMHFKFMGRRARHRNQIGYRLGLLLNSPTKETFTTGFEKCLWASLQKSNEHPTFRYLLLDVPPEGTAKGHQRQIIVHHAADATVKYFEVSYIAMLREVKEEEFEESHFDPMRLTCAVDGEGLLLRRPYTVTFYDNRDERPTWGKVEKTWMTMRENVSKLPGPDESFEYGDAVFAALGIEPTASTFAGVLAACSKRGANKGDGAMRDAIIKIDMDGKEPPEEQTIPFLYWILTVELQRRK